MPTPKVDWVEGEYFTPADANIVGQAIVDLQNEFTTVESVLQFKGTWNATTNTPTLVNGAGTAGHTYLVTTAGTALGKTFVVGDYVVYSGSIWDRATSVASQVTSTGAVTGNTLVSTVATGTAPLTVTSTTNVPNLNASSVSGYTVSSGATNGTLAARDANANLTADNFINSVETTATAAGTTTLTIASGGVQVFTGTTTQTVVLPTTGVLAGMEFQIINNSTGTVTVNSSSGASVYPINASWNGIYTALINTPTTAAHWRGIVYSATGQAPSSSNSLAAFVQSTTNAIGVGTIELGHASDTTLSRSAAGTLAVEGVDVVTTSGAQALTNKTLTSPTITGTPVGVAKNTDVQTFLMSGTWTKPTGAVSVHVRVIGPGAGGGAGARGPSGTALAGGGGGGAGGTSEMMFSAADLTATVAVIVNTGGLGATGQTTDSTAGASGAQGAGGCSFGSYIQAGRGQAGIGGGLAAGGTAGGAGAALFSGGVGGAGSTAGAAGSAPGAGLAAGGGGGGGGITTGAVASAGGVGGSSYANTLTTGSAGTPGGGVGGTGNTTGAKSPGTGGGGGGSSTTTAGGKGGNGGNYGAGGGGGGASLNGFASGGGGNGGDGIVIVTTYF